MFRDSGHTAPTWDLTVEAEVLGVDALWVPATMAQPRAVGNRAASQLVGPHTRRAAVELRVAVASGGSLPGPALVRPADLDVLPEAPIYGETGK